MKKSKRVNHEEKEIMETQKVSKKTKKNKNSDTVKDCESSSVSKKQNSFDTVDVASLEKNKAIKNADNKIPLNNTKEKTIDDTRLKQNSVDDFKVTQNQDSEKQTEKETTLKAVSGGIQPIIAPKGKVQLNPIVVPVAFVPYATQNQPLLQNSKNDLTIKQPSKEETLIKDQPIENKVAPEAKESKKTKYVKDKKTAQPKEIDKKAKNRAVICAVLTLILNVLFLAPVILTKYMPNLKTLGDGTLSILGIPNVIDGWINFNTADIKNSIPLIIFTIPCLLAVVNIVFSIISLITKKPFKFWISALIMMVVTLTGILLVGLGVLTSDMKINIIPLGANSGAYRLFAVALIFFIVSLMYRYRPKKQKSFSKYQEGVITDGFN